MKTNLSRLNKISKILSSTLKKVAAQKITINSWEDMEQEFEDYGSEIRDLWESYVEDFDLEPLRTKDIKSFLDFYNKRSLDLLPEEAVLEEEKLLPKVKSLLIEFADSKGEREDASTPAPNNLGKAKSHGVFGDQSPKWLPNGGFENGPQQHQKRHGKNKRFNNWNSNNAWDLLGPAGTVVHSLTKGKVSSVSPAPSGAYNVFGTHIIISGLDGYPNIFYTHVENVVVKPGDLVEVGTPIAQITTPPTSGMPHHVHIGVEGVHISTLISSNGTFKIKNSSDKAPKTYV
jgi:hypothetical protein